MHSRRTSARYRGFLGILALSLLIGWPGALLAQGKLASRLPDTTIAYAEWHGDPGIVPNMAKNHVLQLIFDPALAPAWAGLGQQIDRSANGQAGMGLAFADVISLLSNPAVVGLIDLPAKPGASAPGTQPEHVGVFAVYDATGKAALVKKLKDTNSQAGPWSSYDFHGTPIESRTISTKTAAASATNTTYRAQVGSYFLVADQKSTIESFVAIFSGNGPAPASLVDRPEFQEAKKYMDSGAAMDFFLRMPDFSHWMTPQGKKMAQTMSDLHPEKFHALGGSLNFAGEATELRGAILGDTSPGSLFDFFGESRENFTAEPLAKMGPVFSASRVNIAAVYDLVHGALLASLPPQQSAGIPMAEAMAQAFLGMPISDALKLFTGEVAYVTTYSEDGTSQQIYAVAIQKPEAILRIMRAVGGKMIVAEDSAGTTTYLDFAYPYRDPVTGTQRRKFYYVAVTPDTILVAPRKAMLRQAQSLMAAPGAPAGVLANPEIQHLRAKLPAKLTGLSASNLAGIPWDKLSANLAQQAERAGHATGGVGKRAPAASAPPDWMKSIPPDVVSRHVHVEVGGSWKDANGLYFESYIQ